MSTATKVAGFLAALAAVLGLAIGVGNAVGPVGGRTGAEHSAGHGADDTAASTTAVAAAELPGGLTVSQDGYTFTFAEARADAGQDIPIAFTIEGADGRPAPTDDGHSDH